MQASYRTNFKTVFHGRSEDEKFVIRFVIRCRLSSNTENLYGYYWNFTMQNDQCRSDTLYRYDDSSFIVWSSGTGYYSYRTVYDKCLINFDFFLLLVLYAFKQPGKIMDTFPVVCKSAFEMLVRFMG